MGEIVFYSGNLSNGGAERVLTILASMLADKGYNVTIITNKTSDKDYYVSDRVNLVVVDCKRSKFPKATFYHKLRRRLATIKFIRKYLKTKKPYAIIPFLDRCINESYLASRFLKVKFIPSLRYMPKLDDKMGNFLKKYVFARSSAVYFQTQSQKDYFSKKIQNKGFVLANPITQEILNAGENKVYSKKIENIISVGRLNSKKNFKMVIDGVILSRKENPNLNLKIYGDGELFKELEEYIIKNNAQDYVKLMGKTNDIASSLLQADLFVLTSNMEGMPNALMEAMATGLPCISTNCPTGPKELLGDNERGILVDMGDTLSLSQEINKLVNDNDYAISLGKLARDYVLNNFTPNIISQKLIKEIKRVN